MKLECRLTANFDKKVQQSWQTSALAMHLALARLVSMPVIVCLHSSSSIVILVCYLFSSGSLNLQDLKMTDQKDQRLENAGPGKWRTKSQGWKMQDLENDGPKRWKMADQMAGLENAGSGKWRTKSLEDDRPLLRPNRNSGSGKCLLSILWKFFYWCTQQ